MQFETRDWKRATGKCKPNYTIKSQRFKPYKLIPTQLIAVQPERFSCKTLQGDLKNRFL
jgi:hypothetical protein